MGLIEHYIIQDNHSWQWNKKHNEGIGIRHNAQNFVAMIAEYVYNAGYARPHL